MLGTKVAKGRYAAYLLRKANKLLPENDFEAFHMVDDLFHVSQGDRFEENGIDIEEDDGIDLNDPTVCER